jgi:hypothetical protein
MGNVQEQMSNLHEEMGTLGNDENEMLVRLFIAVIKYLRERT